MRKKIIIFFIILLQSTVFAQSFNIDLNVYEQYLHKWKQSKPDQANFYRLLDSLNLIHPAKTKELISTVSPNQVPDEYKFTFEQIKIHNLIYLSELNDVLTLIQKNEDYARKSQNVFYQCEVYLDYVDYYVHKRAMKEAKSYALKALDFCKKNNLNDLYPICLITLGKIDFYQGEIAKSHESIVSAIKFLENKPHLQKEQSQAFAVFANIQYEIGNSDLTIFYFQKSIEISLKIHNYYEASKNLGFLALYYFQMGEYDKSLYTLKKGAQLAEFQKNQISLINKHVLFAQIYMKQRKYDLAKEYIEQSINRSQKVGYMQGQAWAKLVAAEYEYVYQRYGQAEKELNSIARIVDSLKHPEIFVEYYGLLYKIHEAKQNFPQAFNYLKEHIAWKEKNQTQQRNNHFLQMGLIFQTEFQKKENEIIRQNQEILEKSNQFQRFVILGITIGLLTALFFSAYYYQQQKKLKHFNQMVLKKNEEIKAQREELLIQSEQLKLQNQELESLDKFKSQMFSMITHDIKTPIINLQMLLTILQNKFNNPEWNEYLNEIRTEVDNTYELIQNFIFWSKHRLNDYEPRFASLELISIITKYLKFFEFNLKQKNLHVINEVENDTLLWADEQLLGHIIFNLLSNAIKYSYPNNFIKVFVSHKDKQLVHLSIENYGKPIPEERLQNLLNLEWNAEKGTNEEIGTGLGLFVSNQFILKMGGKMEYISNKQFTRFTIHIPIADN